MLFDRCVVLCLLALGACSDYAAGTATFTTWGGQSVEQGIPAGDGGFVDGWSVKYQKFLVNFHQIEVKAASGEIAATSPKSYFVDNVVPGKKKLVSFDDVTAKAWERVGYQIKPAVASAVIIAGEPEDLIMMVEAGYSIYAQGLASKDDISKTFAFGFTTGTQYRACHSEQNGKDTAGIVVSDGAEDTSELTTPGDHFFSDHLPGSADDAPLQRFDTLAAADDNGDADDIITLEELQNQPLDSTLYDPSELPVANMQDFLSELARTLGHFRGDGECTLSEAE